MAHNKREMMKAGRAHTKVAGDDEMLRTGYFDGTPLEGGKIADSRHPVDLFAAATRVAVEPQQQQHKEQELAADDGGTTTATTKQTAAANPAAATEATTEQPPAGRRQGMAADAERTDGGRRLGLGRPPPPA